MRTSPPRTRGLPRPLSSFIGREAEIRAVCELLLSGARLVTLTGPGGVGKTRLALAVAEQLSRGYDGEIIFVSLAPIADHELVMPTVARALNIDETLEQTVFDRLADYLIDRPSVIVLDNVEHVLGAAQDIATLMQTCPDLIVLATGREPLKLQGEHDYAVGPLAVPDYALGEPATRESPAVQLFVDRARQASSGFDLTDANRAFVADICRRLDGIPLALELAAARLTVLSPAELLERLDQPLAVLTGGARDLPVRQRTMRATLQWSYELLDTCEQRLFRHLAVISGSATLDAVEAIAPAGFRFEQLASLVEKGLVRVVGSFQGKTRYNMLEPVRQFALEQLVERQAESVVARQQHAEHVVRFFDGLNYRLDGPDGATWLDCVDLEHSNLRATLHWLESTGQVELGLQLIGNVSISWAQRHSGEARSLVRRFLHTPAALERTLARARALWPASWLWLLHGDIETTLAMTDEALSIAEEHGDRRTVAHACFVRAACSRKGDDDERSWTDLERALPIFRELEDDAMVARTLVGFGQVARLRGDLSCSRRFMEEGLELTRQGELTFARGMTLHALGELAENLNDDRLAFKLYTEQLATYHALGISRSMALALTCIARLARRHRRLDQAACLLGAATVQLENVDRIDGRGVHDNPRFRDEFRAMRAIMAEHDFQAAMDRGRSLALEEVIDLAQRSFLSDDIEPSPAIPGGLTPREVEVLSQIAAGRSNRQIANELFISPRTVERHVSNIYRKIDAPNRAAATSYAFQYNIIEQAHT